MNGNNLIANFIIPMGLVFVVFYFMLIMPQKKKEKKTREMLNALKQGDEITTIGGIVGKIINIKDDQLTIETSVEKTQVVIMRWAVRDVKKLEEA
jgi:preprotein translocase subunit YajC